MLAIETLVSSDKRMADWMVFMIEGYGRAIRIFLDEHNFRLDEMGDTLKSVRD
jgi:hypothetical protein